MRKGSRIERILLASEGQVDAVWLDPEAFAAADYTAIRSRTPARVLEARVGSCGADEYRRAGLEPPAAPGHAALAFVELLAAGALFPGSIVIGPRPLGASALGGLSLAFGPEAIPGYFAGRGWIVPGLARLHLHCEMERWSTGVSLGLALRDRLQSSPGFSWSLKEFSFLLDDEFARSLPVGERLAVSCILEAAGAAAAFFPLDEAAQAFLRTRGAPADRILDEPPESGELGEGSIDLGVIEPRVALGGEGWRSRAVVDLPLLRIDQVVIGGDHGARIEDLRLAAALLKEHPVAREVRLIVCPESPKALLHAIHEGVLACLVRAGALVASPLAGLEDRGGLAMLGPQDRGITTGLDALSRPADARLMVASAAVAAASAVLGRVAHPDEVLRRQKQPV